MSEQGNDLRIVQGGSSAKVWLNGVEISKALRGLTVEMNAHPALGTRVHLELAVDTIDISALGEADSTVRVVMPSGVEEALAAIGWVKTGDRTTYRVPRDTEDYADR